MADEWMPTLRLPLAAEEFRRLPRNSAYRYEYLQGQALLTPSPRHYHALLDLHPFPSQEEPQLRRVVATDFPLLGTLFAAVFRQIQPYGSLDDPRRREAAHQALERTRSGGDGPWIEAASFVMGEADQPVGAIFVTLLPAGDPCDWDTYRWKEPPPPDAIERCLGRPHLTWIFVAPMYAGRGTGTALLGAAANALLRLGYRELLSTFMIGNDSSMLWHWRNGFRLLSYPGSVRRLNPGM